MGQLAQDRYAGFGEQREPLISLADELISHGIIDG
jgi:hypothetical protein